MEVPLAKLDWDPVKLAESDMIKVPEALGVLLFQQLHLLAYHGVHKRDCLLNLSTGSTFGPSTYSICILCTTTVRTTERPLKLYLVLWSGVAHYVLHVHSAGGLWVTVVVSTTT